MTEKSSKTKRRQRGASNYEDNATTAERLEVLTPRWFVKGIVAMLASVMLAAASPATAAPLAGLNYLVGTWNCTYRAGTVRFAYDDTYAYERDGHTLR